MKAQAALISALVTLMLAGPAPAQQKDDRRSAAPLPPTRSATPSERLKRPVPLPPRRPAAESFSETKDAVPARPPAPPPPSVSPADVQETAACLVSFDMLGERMPQPANLVTTGPCAVPNPITFQRLRLSDGKTVTLQTPATVRCAFALELAAWIRDDLTAILARNNMAGLAQLTGVGSHECRQRNRQSGGPISEHASGNALDLRALKLTDGRVVALTGREATTSSVRGEVQKSVCARFATVLGPGSDGFHEDHIHIDSRQRNRGYRMCQWTVN